VGLGLFKVIENGAVRSTMYDFLLALVGESAGFCLVRFLLAVIGNAGRHHFFEA